MKNNIFSLFLGLGMLIGLPASPLYAQDFSEDDIIMDLNPNHVLYNNDIATLRGFVHYEKFANEEHAFTDSTGCVTGDGYICIQPNGQSIKPMLPIAVKGFNFWAGTYDVYVVLVPYYYKTGMAPSELPADSIMPNKIKVKVSYLENANSSKVKSTSTIKYTYEGTKVDTLLALENIEIPINYYQSYQNLFPPTVIIESDVSNTDTRKGFTKELRVDRIILKPKSVTPGNTMFEGSCGGNITYQLDTQTRTLTFSGKGELTEFPVLDEFAVSEISHIIIEDGITGIGEGVFAEKTLGKISFPNSLTSIGKKAFYSSTLTELTLPSSVESIADSAFFDVYLKSIELPEGLKSIGNFAFSCASKNANKHVHLEHIKLPNSLESIGKGAFGNLLLSEIELPAGISEIGDSAFFNTDLLSVALPENAKALGEDLFAKTSLHKVQWNVRTIELDNVDPFLSVREIIDTLYIGKNVESLPDELCRNMKISEIAIPDGVKAIGKACFEGCQIATVNIPASVVEIGALAFTTAKDLNVAAGNTAYADVDGVLFSKDKTELVCYPYARIFGYRIPDGVKVISDWAFGSKELVNVYIPASVKSMPLDIFKNIQTISTEWAKAEDLPTLLASEHEGSYPFMVQVPYGSEQIYQQADGWKDCKIVNEYLVGKALEGKTAFSIFRQMLEATGWNKSLMDIEDEEYYRMYSEGKIKDAGDLTYLGFFTGEGTVPNRRYYGFTVFAEKNNVFETLLNKSADAITLKDLTAYLASYYEGKTDEDYTSEEHVLNRFVSYHLLPVKLPKDKLVIHFNELGYDYTNPESKYTIPVVEYYETMGKGRRLMKMSESAVSNGVRINRFIKTDRTTGYEVETSADGIEGIRINKEDSENASYLNGYMYALDELLVYSNETRERLGNERMRHDMAALLPEMANNDLRRPMEGYPYGSKSERLIPREYSYYENLSINPTEYGLGLAGGRAISCYMSGYGSSWCNYQGDEFLVIGNYDITVKLPAVPESGTYELRMGILPNGNRGIAQVYFGKEKENLEPIGLPADFSKAANNNTLSTTTNIIWVKDGSDEVANQINDMHLRENGYMKGSNGHSYTQKSEISSRNNNTTLRKIIGQFQLEEGETYYLRFKSCLDSDKKEFYLDFFEWVPKSVYDNPNEAEDKW